MRQLARQALTVFMLVIALSVASVNGYASALAACPMHEHGGSVHTHAAQADVASDDTTANGHAPSTDTAGHPGDDPASGDSPCKHVQLHSCATFAVTAGDCELAILDHARTTVPVGEAHVLLGQISSPLFRPPRALA
jgi:hypothetical protein